MHDNGRVSFQSEVSGLYACSPFRAEHNDPIELKEAPQLWEIKQVANTHVYR